MYTYLAYGQKRIYRFIITVAPGADGRRSRRRRPRRIIISIPYGRSAGGRARAANRESAGARLPLPGWLAIVSKHADNYKNRPETSRIGLYFKI